MILVVVILFMGFPTVYTTMSIYLFVPLMAVLMGVVARGTAFTFRHYDPDGRHQLYTHLFAGSSVWTSAWLGATAGAMVLGRIDPEATTVWSLYVAPWANPFCLAMAVFTPAAFALLAAVYLPGEEEATRPIFHRKSRIAAMVLVPAGAVVFATGGLPFISRFLSTPASVAASVAATALLVPFWRTRSRPLGAGIVTLVRLGWFAVQYPVAVQLTHGALTFPDAAAPDATLRALVGALLVGSCVIFPGLGYLMVVFKRQTF